MKFFVKLICFLALFCVVERFCHRQTAGFRPHKILGNTTSFIKAAPPPLSEDKLNALRQITGQTFSFLGSGGQCYTFLSSDEKYVLKVFKHHHMRSNHILNSFQWPARLDIYRKKLMGGPLEPGVRLKNFLTSCQIAYEELKEQTGLIYLHLDQTKIFSQKITLLDKLGIAHVFDLDKLTFAVQKKAELVHPTFRRLIGENKIESAKRHIDSLIEVILGRCQKGILNNDPVIKRNFGFVDELAVEIDIGSLEHREDLKNPNSSKQEVCTEIASLKKWLSRKNGILANYIDEKMADLL